MEVGIAAGLDVPTAMVISDRGDAGRQPTEQTNGSQAVVVAVIAGAAAMAVAYVLR